MLSSAKLSWVTSYCWFAFFVANMGSTAETICSAPAREKEEAIFICVSLHSLPRGRKELWKESSPLYLCEAKAAVASLFDSSAWALELIISLPATLILCHTCASVSASHWAVGLLKRTEWALKPCAVACSGWVSPHAMAHRAASAVNSLGQAFYSAGFGFWETTSPPSPELYAEMMQENAGFSHSMLCPSLAVAHRDGSTRVMKRQIMSWIKNSMWITMKQNNKIKFDMLTCSSQNHFHFLDITKIFH